MGTPATNTLFYGDNLTILREYMDDASVDLVYLDPPFNSNRTYNVLFKEKSGEASPAQMEAFHDTWAWDEAAGIAYESLMQQAPPDVARMVVAMREFVGDNDMMAYLVMMAQRLVELHRVLKPTGSLYLHCDPTVSQYLKVLLDSVFGPRNFRNEITWQRTNVHSDSKRWSDVSDRILYYVKDQQAGYVWNPPYMPLSDAHVQSKYSNVDADGRRFTLSDMTSPNPRPNMMYEWMGHASPAMGWRYSRETMTRLDAEGRIWYPRSKEQRPRLKRYLDEQKGRLLGDVWTDIPPINSQAQERLGYPTQKPLALLERIINASSNPGDVVLDPFCGCGTAIAAAERLGRRWLGIDITYLAIAVMKQRFEDHFPENVTYQVIGDPQDVPSARDLFLRDAFQFQWWAVDKLGIGARPAGGKKKRGADRGIDGEFFFAADRAMHASRGIVQVKGGRPQVKDVRDFRGTMEREQAPIGVFISLDEPTAEMKREAVAAGFYTSDVTGKAVARLQLRTVADLFAGRGVDIPALFGAFQQAPALKRTKDQARTLDLPILANPDRGGRDAPRVDGD